MMRICTVLVCAAVAFGLALGVAPSARAVTIDFETALGNDDDDFIATNGPGFGGLNWTQNGDLVGESRWEIDTDNDPFASLDNAMGDPGSKWIQGFAEGITTAGGALGDPNRAKFGWNGTNSFEFESMWLRARQDTDQPIGFIDSNTDGVDDRWLTEVLVTFRDIANNESSVLIDLAATADWIELEAGDVAGPADLTQLKAIFFEGDTSIADPLVYDKLDRFAIDNLTVVPEPSTAALLLIGLGALGSRGRRRGA